VLIIKKDVLIQNIVKFVQKHVNIKKFVVQDVKEQFVMEEELKLADIIVGKEELVFIIVQEKNN